MTDFEMPEALREYHAEEEGYVVPEALREGDG